LPPPHRHPPLSLHDALPISKLRDRTTELRRGRLRIDHRQLRNRLQSLRVVPRVFGAGIVERPAEGHGEVAIETGPLLARAEYTRDRKSTRLNSSHDQISYAG